MPPRVLNKYDGKAYKEYCLLYESFFFNYYYYYFFVYSMKVQHFQTTLVSISCDDIFFEIMGFFLQIQYFIYVVSFYIFTKYNISQNMLLFHELVFPQDWPDRSF